MTGSPEPPPEGAAMPPADRFAGHVVLVAGGGARLGLAMGLEFTQLGAAAAAAAAAAVASRDAGLRARGVTALEAAGFALDLRDPARSRRPSTRSRPRRARSTCWRATPPPTSPSPPSGSAPTTWRAATWLRAPFAAYATGHVLVVDGGDRLDRSIRKTVFEPARDLCPEGPR